MEEKRPFAQIRADIEALIAYLPADTPELALHHNELSYLMSYTWERDGQTEEALAGYMTLIERAPSSPWSWLAWSRLE